MGLDGGGRRQRLAVKGPDGGVEGRKDVTAEQDLLGAGSKAAFMSWLGVFSGLIDHSGKCRAE